jgi:hypothetical protein
MTDDKKGQQQIIAGRVYDDEEVTPILKFLAIFISVLVEFMMTKRSHQF